MNEWVDGWMNGPTHIRKHEQTRTTVKSMKRVGERDTQFQARGTEALTY